MKCKAKYIGPDKDRGYFHGSIYMVKIYMHKKYIFVEPYGMWVRGYSSMAKLIEDWDFSVGD